MKKEHPKDLSLFSLSNSLWLEGKNNKLALTQKVPFRGFRG